MTLLRVHEAARAARAKRVRPEKRAAERLATATTILAGPPEHNPKRAALVKRLVAVAGDSASGGTSGSAPLDATPPQVSSIVPANGAKGVTSDAKIVITFSEAVGGGGVDYECGGARL